MNWTKLRECLVGDKGKEAPPPKLAIPALPTTVMEFCRAAENPETSLGELATILDRDAGMVVEILRMVNTSANGLRNKVNSSRAALGLLGARRAKMFVLTSSMQSMSQKMKSPLADARQFSFAAMQRAVFARRLAERLGHDADLAFAAALLQDFAVPPLTAESTSRYQSLLRQLDGTAGSLADAERGRFGWDHALAGSRLMMSWNFPDELVCLVLAHHRLDVILETPALKQSELLEVALSGLLPDPLDNRPSRQALLEQHLKTVLDIDAAALQAWVAEDLQYTGVAQVPALAWKSRPNGPAAPKITGASSKSAVA